MKEEDIIAEMTIQEWLDRQNLLKYIPHFTKNKIFLVSEIKHHVDDQGKFNDKFEFLHIHEQMRIGLMARGDTEGKKEFEYQTVQNARRIIQKFVKNVTISEQLVGTVEEQGITGF